MQGPDKEARMRVEIRRPDGSVEDTVAIGDREPAADVTRALRPLAGIYAGTGYEAWLVIDGQRPTLVGRFEGQA
jgi:hypothetical protein